MRNLTIAGVFVSLGVLAACSDAPVEKATSPDFELPRTGRSVSVACQSAYSLQVKRAQDSIFAAGATLDSIKALWKKVDADCSTNNTTRMAKAQEAFMEYVRFTIITFATRSGDIIPTDKSKTTTDHWDLAFPYVTYAAPGLSSSSLTNGAAKVITVADLITTPEIEFGIPTLAAMTVRKQLAGGDQRGHLFVIYPLSTDCLPDNSALTESGSCFEFSSFPAPSSTFNPRLKVGICYTDAFVTPALAHYTGGATAILQAIVYPSVDFCHDAGSTRYGSTGLFGRVTRLASRLFGVKPAYAAHGGLGTLPPGTSPFVPVDRNIFMATFSALAPGDIPALGALPSPDKGFWTRRVATSPGSITVQQSLADLITKPVVLAQAGGNCGTRCGGLDLWGQVKTADATNTVNTGKYLITWTSVQDQPSPKAAPFVVRSNAGLEIARLSYSKEPSGNKLRYNDQIVPGATWVRGQAQIFTILVDFSANPTTTTLTVTTNPFGLSPTTVTVGPKNFVESAADLSRIQAEFSGIDSGVVGWDNITIERVADTQ